MTKLIEGDMNEALRVGVVLGNIGMINDSLSSGADINMRDSDGWTAIMHSCLAGNEEVTRLLLEKGADYKMKNPEKQSAFEIATEKTSGIITEWIERCERAQRLQLGIERRDSIEEIVNDLNRDIARK
ncbi:MAG: ankyrin repeat domain-containing protein [Candidatus Micrarchaeota archaeon]|nr:ankyrin repeat domain-containing protein [Candidatus Micrarchaeota archaeon]